MTDQELEALASQADSEFTRRRRTVDDFRYDEQQEKFWDTTTGNLLGARSVDGAVHPDDWPTRNGEDRPIRPSIVINNIDTGLTVEGSTWWPGLPRFIKDIVVSERGAMKMKGAVCYNSYIPPDRSERKNGVSPQPWIDHVKMLYPEPLECEHFFDFCAHALQRPDEKVNHGIVMAGTQGIGKDTALIPVRHGVGEWNAAEIGPDAVSSQYNGYVRAVLLVINEVRPHDEDFRASNFYNLLKPMLAAPPEMLPMTLKYANTFYVRNLAHVILTTNDPLTMFIPPEDRRLFVMSSQALAAPPIDYFTKLHRWLNDGGGTTAVVHWLTERDLSGFLPSEPPPITKGKRAIIDSAHQVRRTMIDEIFERYIEERCGGERPKIFFHRDLTDFVRSSNMFDDAEATIKQLNAKNFHFKISERGYDMERNPNAAEWRSGKFRSRMAFCAREVPYDGREALIAAALAERA